MQTEENEKGLEKAMAVIMVRPRDVQMSFWLKRVMWLASVAMVLYAFFCKDRASIIASAVIAVVWIVDAGLSDKKIYFFFDVFCMTVVSAALSVIFLSGAMGSFGVFAMLITSVMGFFMLGVFWGGIFGVFHSLLLSVIMYMPSLEWIQSAYGATFCRRFPYMFICFVLVGGFLEYRVQEYWKNKYDYQTKLNELIDNGRKERSEVSIKVLLAMHTAMSAKVPLMKQHSDAVGEWTRNIAGIMGYRNEELQTMYYAGLLHDVGKIGIPDSILQKEGELTDDEYRIYMQHVDIGYEILHNLKQPEIADAARYHHEKMDGSGFKVVRGTSIPPVARMVAVANYVVRREELKVKDEQIIKELLELKEEKFEEASVDAAVMLLLDRIRRAHEEQIFG